MRHWHPLPPAPVQLGRGTAALTRPIHRLRRCRRISTRFLQGIKKSRLYELPETPLIAFINARSGGQLGPSLAHTLYRALGNQQVRRARIGAAGQLRRPRAGRPAGRRGTGRRGTSCRWGARR